MTVCECVDINNSYLLGSTVIKSWFPAEMGLEKTRIIGISSHTWPYSCKMGTSM